VRGGDVPTAANLMNLPSFFGFPLNRVVGKMIEYKKSAMR